MSDFGVCGRRCAAVLLAALAAAKPLVGNARCVSTTVAQPK